MNQTFPTVIVYLPVQLDRIYLWFCPSVCVCGQMVVERLRWQFLKINFYQIMHAAYKCGDIDAQKLFVGQTRSRNRILVVCKFRFWQFSVSDHHVFQHINTKFCV